MRRSYFYGCVLVVAGMAIGLAARGASPAQPAARAAWEYKAVGQWGYPGNLEKEFNDLGAQGWEYCGSHVTEYRKEGETIRPVTVSVFKRSRSKPGE